jgi:hypothetical protein
MLALNMQMNGFTILSIVSLFRAGRQDGAVIMARRDEDGEFVVTEVDQVEIDRPDPADHWMQGHYFPADAQQKVAQLFLERTQLVYLADPPKV